MRTFLASAILLLTGCGSSPSDNITDSIAADDSASADETLASDGGDDTSNGDTGASDTGSVPTDTSMPSSDTGTADTGTADTGTADTGTKDSGPPDTGPSTCTSATCPAAAGNYAGPYSIYTAEKLGSTVINEVQCTGTNAITIDLSKSPALTGTVTCKYAGSLSAFDKTESGTISGSVFPDGTVSGTLTHKFGSGMEPSFSFKGTLASNKLTVIGTGSWKPNPMSAVPWEVKFSFTSNKL